MHEFSFLIIDVDHAILSEICKIICISNVIESLKD